MHFHLIGLNCRYTHSCLALFYVRNELNRNIPGSNITISQYTINDTYYDTLLRIADSGADVLCFSVYIWNADYFTRLLHDLYRVQPERRILLGGPQASALNDLPENCTIVKGEIEGVGLAFYQDLMQGKPAPFYSAQPGREFAFPYLDEDFSEQLSNRQVYYESSRGCPFRCSYCLSSISKGVHHKDFAVVCDEIKQILARHPRIIKFVDRTFNDNPERALALWKFLASQPGETMFHFEIAPDRFTDAMLEFLNTVGPDRFQFEIGVQSTHPETLNAINRQMDVEQAESCIRQLVELDTIHLHVDLILGLPYETEESFKNSFNRVFSLQPHYIQMGLLKVLPGTEIEKEADELKLVYCKQPPYQVLANSWMDFATTSKLHAFGECVEAFYNTRYFRTVWQYVHRADEDPFTFFEKLLQTCIQHNWQDVSLTQKFLTGIMYDAVKDREDSGLFFELLRFDWLRCGHRFLPGFLESRPLSGLRSALRSRMPQNLKGYFTYQNRNEFFKQGVFIDMSGKALREVGLGGGDEQGLVCFFPEQATGVIKLNRAELIPW